MITSIYTTVIALASQLDRSAGKRGLGARASGGTKPAGSQGQPLWGGPLLTDCCVARQSLCISIAPSSLLALGQNRLRHGGVN